MLRLLWIAGLLGCVAGCPPTKPAGPPAKTTQSEAERPPLRVFVMGDDSWSDVISRRWPSISEQRLDLQAKAAEEILSSTSINADILVFESRWLPTLVEQGLISPLPKSISESLDDSPSGSSNNRLRPNRWPLVWRQSATYGQRLWGIPLGVPMLVIARNSESQNVSFTTWRERASQRNARSHGDPWKNENPRNANSYLLDRFLMIAASLNPRPDDAGFLFNINSGQARLHETWLLDAATIFGQLYADNIESVNMSPELAWEYVATRKSDWALAWPSWKGDSTLAVQAPERWVDTGRGLVAASTTKNRQSGPANRFLNWLDEDAQRQEFASLTTAIQPTPERWSSSSDRVDVNRYRELVKHALDDRFIIRELRFADSQPYRQRLEEALRAIIIAPSNAAAELKRCASDWDQLTAKRGRDIQRKRLSRSFELEVYRE